MCFVSSACTSVLPCGWANPLSSDIDSRIVFVLIFFSLFFRGIIALVATCLTLGNVARAALRCALLWAGVCVTQERVTWMALGPMSSSTTWVCGNDVLCCSPMCVLFDFDGSRCSALAAAMRSHHMHVVCSPFSFFDFVRSILFSFLPSRALSLSLSLSHTLILSFFLSLCCSFAVSISIRTTPSNRMYIGELGNKCAKSDRIFCLDDQSWIDSWCYGLRCVIRECMCVVMISCFQSDPQG